MSIQVKVGNIRIRCVGGYGPQLEDDDTKKDEFWKYLTEEVETANETEVGLIIQIDSNCHAGRNLIPNDPHSRNKNGRRLEAFLKENPGIFIVNSLSLCKGLITRQRTTTIGEERSVLDLFLVCFRVFPLLKEMFVDEKKEFQLTASKHKNKTIESDHNLIELKIDRTFNVTKPSRKEDFNLKDKDGQLCFKELTTTTSKFTNQLNVTVPFQEKIKLWQKTLNSFIHQSFTKIRGKKRKYKENEVGKLIEKRKKIKLEARKNPHEDDVATLEKIEDEIASKTDETLIKNIKEAFGSLTGDDGGINIMGMWSLKNKLFPKQGPNIPIALKDKEGNLITDPEANKEFALESIVERLRHRPNHPNIDENIFKMKEELAEKRIEFAKKMKTNPWTNEEVLSILKSLKKGKCRDPHGLIYEITNPDFAGADLLNSILRLMNETKDHLQIPEFMTEVDIALLPKPNKSDIHDISNHRGIFLLSIFRTILMKLILKDEYQTVDSFMSDSNIGGRKNRNIRDHLFIVNGILHEANSSVNQTPLTIQILDYQSCFDSLWQSEIINELFSAGIQNDKLVLLYNINKTNKISIRTPFGKSRRQTVDKIICQGDSWGSIECSLMIDGFGKESLKEEMEPFKYKGKVPIPVLGMVDDLLAISETGYKTNRMNGFLNAKTSLKKLQFGPEKCAFLNIGKRCEKYQQTELFIDGWKMKQIKHIETGLFQSQEIYQGDIEMEEKISDKYLGQIISRDGKNTKNIEMRALKGIKISKTILSILNRNPGGKYNFEIAKILRNALLISSILSGSEVWYGLTLTEIEKLEEIDESLLRQVFESSKFVTKVMLYFELSVLPIRHLIKMRRVLYLQDILKQKQNSLLHTFFVAQLENETHGDWASQVMQDLEDLEITLNLSEIKEMSKFCYKSIVRKQVVTYALSYLNKLKQKHDHIKTFKYESLQIANYLSSSELSNIEKKFIFACRSNDLDLKGSKPWFHKDLLCICCNLHTEDISHIIQCSRLVGKNELITYIPIIEDLEGSLDELIYLCRIIKENMKRRKDFIV